MINRRFNFSRGGMFRLRSLVPCLLALFVWLGVSESASAAVRVCVRWQAKTVDSGHGEDRIAWADSPGAIVTAYGVRIQYALSGTSNWTTRDTGASSGCVDLPNPPSTYDIRVFEMVADENLNRIRYHDGGDGEFGLFPGATYSHLVTGVVLQDGANYLDVGGWSHNSTTMATASMMSRYFPGLSSYSKIHISDDNSCKGSSAHHCTGDCRYSWGQAYVRLMTDNLQIKDGMVGFCGNHTRRKFVVAHEIGHARAIAYQRGKEPNVDESYNNGSVADCSSELYSMRSEEWNSVSFREGFAHFAALWTFNYHWESGGFIRWFEPLPFDAELNDPSVTGGWIGNTCGGVTDGRGTNLDAMRLFWDWTTPSTSAGRASLEDVMDTYRRMVDRDPERDEYWSEFYGRAQAHLSDAKVDLLSNFACWNGLETC